jgi:hypothetical protein
MRRTVQAVGFVRRVRHVNVRRVHERLAAISALLLMLGILGVPVAIIVIDLLISSAVGAFHVTH